MINFKQQFIVLFHDSTIIKFAFDEQEGDSRLKEEINKIESTLQFEKNLNKFPTTRKKIDFYEQSSIQSDIHFQCLGIYSLDENKDPKAYFKFKTKSITDIVVLLPEHFSYSCISQECIYEPLIIAFTDFDGYLRIIDIHNLYPIFLFKSNYGGINSVVFENDTSPICVLGCQDDSTIIINMQTNAYLRVTGSISFISRGIFLDIKCDEFLRIISSSYDGSFSINDIQRNLLDGIKEQNTKKEQDKKYPIKIFYDKNICLHQHLSEEYIINVNDQGLGFIDCCGLTIASSAFDGCSSVWQFMDTPPQTEKYEEKSKTTTYNSTRQQLNQNSYKK